MEEKSGLVPVQKELQESLADIEVQIEGAIDEFELLHATIQKRLK